MKFHYLAPIFMFSLSLIHPLVSADGIIKDYGVYYAVGRADQDRHDVQPEQNPHYFAIFDGHGEIENVAPYLEANLYDEFKKIENCTNAFDQCQIFGQLFSSTDRSLYEEKIKGGSTALVACVDEKIQTLYVINLGDCRAVIKNANNVIALSTDLKAADKNEQLRIKCAGGLVLFDQGARVNGDLIPSRSFGDFEHKNYKNDFNGNKDQHPVSPYPQVSAYPLSQHDNFLILASDGLWDGISNEDAVSFVTKKLDENIPASTIAQELVTQVRTFALEKLDVPEEDIDDITALIIVFNKNELNSRNTLKGFSDKQGTKALAFDTDPFVGTRFTFLSRNSDASSQVEQASTPTSTPSLNSFVPTGSGYGYSLLKVGAVVGIFLTAWYKNYFSFPKKPTKQTPPEKTTGTPIAQKPVTPQ